MHWVGSHNASDRPAGVTFPSAAERFARHPSSSQAGFTLIELIIVIILLGITSTFVFNYLGFGAQVFRDTTEREQLVSQSRFAVERLSRELSNSLPRSVRVTEQGDFSCLEYTPVIGSSAYLQIPVTGPESANDFIGIYPEFIEQPPTNDLYLFVAANSTQQIYGSLSERRKVVMNLPDSPDSEGLINIELESGETFSARSPGRRFFVAKQPRSWCYNQTLNELRLHKNYGINETQQVPPSNSETEVMARNIFNDLLEEQSPFRVMPAQLMRDNIVQIHFIFKRSQDGEPLLLQHEVHIPNVP